MRIIAHGGARTHTRAHERDTMGKIIDYKRTTAYRKIKASLLKRLEQMDALDGYNVGMVDTYMELWVDTKRLEDDIKKRGYNIETVDARGTEIVKKNDSVGEKVRVSNQMIRILECMGLKQKEQPKQKQQEDSEDGL